MEKKTRCGRPKPGTLRNCEAAGGHACLDGYGLYLEHAFCRCLGHKADGEMPPGLEPSEGAFAACDAVRTGKTGKISKTKRGCLGTGSGGGLC